VICWQGEPCSGLYIIRQGSVKLFKLSTKGRELIIKVFEEGATFNEVPVFDNGLNVVNVAALEDCEIWVVSAEAVQQVLHGDTHMAQAVIHNLTHNMRMLVDLIEDLSFHQVTNRLARLINQLPAEQLQGQAHQRITQDQMAARLGTVREVVARSLRELERSGAIRVQRRQIQIVNEVVLQAWAQESPDS
jgi:CRP/FNR family transcriptional regulator